MQAKRIHIIGSGFGGLAEAIRLQSRGFDVTIFEKRNKVGGRAYQFTRNGYVFDMGPSLITAPFIIERVFTSAGKRMADYVDIVPLDPFYRIYFHDKSSIDYSGDPVAMKKAMALFNAGDAANYDRFFADIKRIYDAVIVQGLGAQPFLSLKSFLEFVPRAFSLGGLTPVYSLAKKYFKDGRNRFIFSFHPLFIGGSPFRAPGIYSMIPYLERQGGVWFARGGMYSLVQAFEKLFRELGGTIHTNTEVQEVLVHDDVAVGVKASGRDHYADAVISNGDVASVYKNLVPARNRKRWSDTALDRMHYSMSCFLLYIGTRKQFPQLAHHTLILSERYKELVKDIFDRKVLPEDFSMYLHVPTRTDSSMAPPGCESMYLLVPVPHLGSGIDWKKQAKPFADRILRFLESDFGLAGLKESIEVLETFTPDDFAGELNAHLGNAFSFEPRLTQSAYFRPHNRSEDLRRFYLVGAGTHPGGGVPGVLLSAEATEKCVIEDLGLPVPIPIPSSINTLAV